VPYTIADIERLLDTGKLEILMRNGNYWQLRRNGATKRWKRDPERFRIPIKFGLRNTGAIETTDLDALGIREKTTHEPAGGW
jgi:hypothetical protein